MDNSVLLDPIDLFRVIRDLENDKEDIDDPAPLGSTSADGSEFATLSGAAVSSGVQCTPVAKKKHRVGELGLMKAAFNYMHGPLPGISSGSGEPAPAGVGQQETSVGSQIQSKDISSTNNKKRNHKSMTSDTNIETRLNTRGGFVAPSTDAENENILQPSSSITCQQFYGTSRNVRKAIAGPTTITGGNIQTTGVSKSPLLTLREKNINRPIPESNKKTRRTRSAGFRARYIDTEDENRSSTSTNSETTSNTSAGFRALSIDAEVANKSSAVCTKETSAGFRALDTDLEDENRPSPVSNTEITLNTTVNSSNVLRALNACNEDENNSSTLSNSDTTLNTSAEFRALYTIDEDERILRHFLGHGGFSIRKGNFIWKKMESNNIVPGRTWQSLKQRFLKTILVNKLKLHKITLDELEQADLRAREKEEELGSTSKYYTAREDQEILAYICSTGRFSETGGVLLWQEMEQEIDVLPNRTWASIKERFRKVILKNINNYKLSEEELLKFNQIISTPSKGFKALR